MGCAQSARAREPPQAGRAALAKEQQRAKCTGETAHRSHQAGANVVGAASDVVGVRDNAAQQESGLDHGAAGQMVQHSRSLVVRWHEPPRPLDEEQRWTTMCQLNILDTAPEEVYDNITRLCMRAFQVPIATVSFVDGDRVWFKSVVGLDVSSIERSCSICSWTVLARHPTALVVPDLKDDARLSRLPLVTSAPYARFYAGAPLVASNGHVIGSLCILDTKPRKFGEQDTKLLAQLATLVMKEVERREQVNDAVGRSILEPEGRCQSMAADVAHDSQAMMLCDVSDPKWPILFTNSAWEAQTGVSRGVACGANFWDLFAPLAARHAQAYTLATKQQRPFQLRLRCTPPGAGDSACDHVHLGHKCVGSHKVQMQFLSMNSSHGNQLQSAAAIAIPTLYDGRTDIDTASGRYYWATVIPAGGPSTTSTSGTAPSAEQLGRRSAGSDVKPASASSSGGSAFRGPHTGIGSNGSSHGQRNGEHGSAAHSSGGHGSGPQGRGAGGSCSSSRMTSVGTSASDMAGGTGRGSSGSGRMSPGADNSAASAAAGPADGLVGREVSTIDASFVLLPEEQDAFSNIQLGNLLGKGAFGSVYRGRWSDTVVAVKIVDAGMRHNPHAALEPLLHTQLNHPNIVQLFGISSREVPAAGPGDPSDWLHEDEEEEGVSLQRTRQEVWMVMEFCNRGTLSDAIARGALAEMGPDGTRVFGTVNMRRLVSTMREIASAMAYLHAQNVLHGDLTANNVMLVTDRTQRKGFAAKVSDFGLSRIISAEEQRINTRTHGTITHMAPEVVTSGTHSHKADVYSFGMVMLEAYRGECPFQGMHYAQVVQHVMTGEALPVPEDAPPDVQDLLHATLAHNPDDRPTFTEIYQRLCDMEVAIKQADASKPGHVKARPAYNVIETPSSAQAVMSAAELSPSALCASPGEFDTVAGLVSDSNAGNILAADASSAVHSF